MADRHLKAAGLFMNVNLKWIILGYSVNIFYLHLS